MRLLSGTGTDRVKVGRHVAYGILNDKIFMKSI